MANMPRCLKPKQRDINKMMNSNFKEDISKKGEVGTRWLKSIPEIIRNLEKDWGIKAGKQFDIYFNYVLNATKNDGTKVVLKIVFPEDKSFQSEIDALRVFNGEGCVRLLEVSLNHFALLLEKAVPGVALDPSKDENETTRIIASIIKKLNKPVPSQHHFEDVKDFAKKISDYKQKYKDNNPLPQYLVDKAEDLINYLIKTSQELVVNHGDLHYGNVLSAKRETYLAIDPKGIVAEKAFETGCILRNPYPTLVKQPNVKEILLTRIKILAEELELDPERIKQWGFVQAVLGAIWRVEDYGTHYEHSIKIAEILNQIKV